MARFGITDLDSINCCAHSISTHIQNETGFSSLIEKSDDAGITIRWLNNGPECKLTIKYSIEVRFFSDVRYYDVENLTSVYDRILDCINFQVLQGEHSPLIILVENSAFSPLPK